MKRTKLIAEHLEEILGENPRFLANNRETLKILMSADIYRRYANEGNYCPGGYDKGKFRGITIVIVYDLVGYIGLYVKLEDKII